MGETQIQKSPLEVHLIFTGPDVLSALQREKRVQTKVNSRAGTHRPAQHK